MKSAPKIPDYVSFGLQVLGFLFCILPPTICTMLYFPLWNECEGGKSLAGGCALLLTISLYPLIKYLRKTLSSVSSYVIWLAIFIAFLLLSKIADEMTVISFFGFIGNLVGAICFAIDKARRRRDERI